MPRMIREPGSTDGWHPAEGGERSVHELTAMIGTDGSTARAPTNEWLGNHPLPERFHTTCQVIPVSHSGLWGMHAFANISLLGER